MRGLSTFISIPRRGWRTWQQFWVIYRCLERRADLERLIVWAARKRLSGPLNLYQTRLSDEEQRLFRHRIHHPRPLWYAHVLFWLMGVVCPPKRYYSKGAAAVYRY